MRTEVSSPLLNQSRSATIYETRRFWLYVFDRNIWLIDLSKRLRIRFTNKIPLIFGKLDYGYETVAALCFSFDERFHENSCAWDGALAGVPEGGS